jgi:hypothetical protein
MRSSRLFRTIWRVNGVLLLLTFVLVAGGTVVAAIASISWGHHEKADAAVVAPSGEKLMFTGVEAIEGSPLVVIPLMGDDPSDVGLSGPSGGHVTRNLLFYDAGAGIAQWLRRDHRAAILEHQQLRASGSDHLGGAVAPADDPVRWIRYELATVDTNHDGEVDRDDAIEVALTGIDGKDLAIVIDGIDSVLGYASPGKGKLVVFFRKGGTDQAGEIDLATRKLVKTTPLPKS